MSKTETLESPVWSRFQAAARRRRRDPMRLLRDYMQECLEIWEDQRLDEEIRRDVRRSGRREVEAVQVVRQYRREKRNGRGGS